MDSDLEQALTQFLLYFCVFSPLIVLILKKVFKNQNSIKFEKKLQQSIRDKDYYSVKEFLDLWVNRKAKNGLKHNDRTGCYVFFFFKDHNAFNNGKYENVYVGQSVRVYDRVHTHIKGKGNGDVYADIKNGKVVYIKFYYCKGEELNNLETKLISEYKARESYNKTYGGSKRTYYTINKTRKVKRGLNSITITESGIDIGNDIDMDIEEELEESNRMINDKDKEIEELNNKVNELTNKLDKESNKKAKTKKRK